jgi:hypothetical protein
MGMGQESQEKKFWIDRLTGFLAVLESASIVALVVGYFMLKGRRTGNPVRFRDGPRRCNRVLTGTHSISHYHRSLGDLVRRLGTPELGSQKTYQRKTCGPPRGTEAVKLSLEISRHSGLSDRLSSLR